MDIEPSKPATVTPARYVLLSLDNVLTGYTVKAMQRKIERGDWQEGKVWRRAPDQDGRGSNRRAMPARSKCSSVSWLCERA